MLTGTFIILALRELFNHRDNLIHSLNVSNDQVINRIEQNTLNIHKKQSANQTIMMNAIIDKIGIVKVSNQVLLSISFSR